MFTPLVRPVVEPVFAKVAGGYVSAGGGAGFNTLSLTYDIDTSEMTITTNGAGTLVWMISTPTSATPAEIIAGTGAVLDGTIPTLPGTNTAFIDDTGLTPGVEYWFHAVLTSDGTTVISPATSVRVQQAAVTTYATINPLTGSPTIYNYTDGDGTWRAYEWTQNGSFEVTVAGDVDYLMVGGGGGGGAWTAFTCGGGGGAGGLLQGTELFLATGTQSITIGQGGLGGRSNGPQRSSQSGTNTVALGLTAFGGGRGGARDDPAGVNQGNGDNGGSGGGMANQGLGPTGAGTLGQGNDGGRSTISAAAGGGGAGAVGQDPTSSTIAGAGGAGVQSSITGTARFYAGGGAGASYAGTVALGGSGVGGNGANGGFGTGTHIGGNGAANTGSGGGGGGAEGATLVGGNGANGVFIIRVKLA